MQIVVFKALETNLGPWTGYPLKPTRDPSWKVNGVPMLSTRGMPFGKAELFVA